MSETVHGNLFRPGQEPLLGALIQVRDGRIAAVRPGPPSKEWILPGLIDAHVHFFQSGGLYTRPDIIDLTARVPYEEERRQIRERLPDTFARYIRSGVTAVADCGGPFWNFDVRALAERTPLAPRVAVAGPLVSTYGPKALQTEDPPIIEVHTPEEARSLVRRQLEHKPDFVKIWYILQNRKPEDLLPIARATIETSHAAGARVAVHATELETARAAVQAGADILVHSVYDREVDDAFLELLKKRNTLYVTTLMVVERYVQSLSHTLRLTAAEHRIANPHVTSTLFDRFEEKTRAPAPAGKRNAKRILEAGIVLAAGTDAGNIGTPHGPAIFRELELLVEAGLAPAQALTAATLSAAKVLGKEREIGSIEPGKRADLVVLNSSPLDDIRNAADIRLVMKGGRAWRPEEILRKTPVDVVQEQVNAYNARDVEAFLATYADDIVIVREGREVMRGHDAMRERYGRLFAENPRQHVAITRRESSGAVVVDDEHVTGRSSGVEVRARARYEVEGGSIRRVTFLPVEP